MFDKFFQTLSFAADPPEGSGGTKTKIGGSGFVTGDAVSSDPPVLPADPPEGSGGGGTESGSTTETSKAAE